MCASDQFFRAGHRHDRPGRKSETLFGQSSAVRPQPFLDFWQRTEFSVTRGIIVRVARTSAAL